MEEKEMQVDLIPTKAEIVPLSSSDVARMEEAAKNYQRVLGVALRMTNSKDWVDQGGNPYLQGSGAEKVAVPFGISYGPVGQPQAEEREDADGKYVIFSITYFAEAFGRKVQYTGRASTRGKFFSHNNKRRFEEIPIPHVMAQAQTNAIGNCITRILGIRNLTWEQLGEYGIRKDGATAVAYKKSGHQAEKSGSSLSAQSQNKNSPKWKSEFKGDQFVFGRVGDVFEESFLVGLGMQKGKENGVYFSKSHVDEIWAELEKMEEFQKKGANEPA